MCESCLNATLKKINRDVHVPMNHAPEKEGAVIVFFITNRWENYRAVFSHLKQKEPMTEA